MSSSMESLKTYNCDNYLKFHSIKKISKLWRASLQIYPTFHSFSYNPFLTMTVYKDIWPWTYIFIIWEFGLGYLSLRIKRFYIIKRRILWTLPFAQLRVTCTALLHILIIIRRLTPLPHPAKEKGNSVSTIVQWPSHKTQKNAILTAFLLVFFPHPTLIRFLIS